MGGVRGRIGFCSWSPFYGMFTSIDYRVGITTVTFSQLYGKIWGRHCRSALRLDIGTMVFSFALVVEEMKNRKCGCGDVTV